MERIKSLDILTPDQPQETQTVRISPEENRGNARKLYIESYGCQMNFSDSEIVTSILQEKGFDTTSDFNQADVILLNTCAIRDNAEQKVRNRLKHLTGIKRTRPGTLIGVLGCMAERLKAKFLEEEKIVDMVVGPDAYRDLPKLIEEAEDGQKGINVFLSRDETYADITPVRLNTNGVTAFISIMRGCDNMCSFCVVPFTRGRERSRDALSIVREAEDLFSRGYREVTLLGQNVDSYKWTAPPAPGGGARNTASIAVVPDNERVEGKEADTETVNFAQLLEKVALVSPDLRVRFSTSHPKDITDEVLHTMARHENICKYIHLPAQSGNTRVLGLMNRTYTRDWYLDRIAAIRRILGNDCGISTDMIAGFCTETADEHQDTLSLMEAVQYDFAYMFAYSERPNTPAAKKLKDDIAEDEKKRRLNEIIALQGQHSLLRNRQDLHKVHKVLVEGVSKRSEDHLFGRNSANKVVVFPRKNFRKGQYVEVSVTTCTAATLMGDTIG